MALLNQPKYLSFDHQYVETVVVTDISRIANGVAANRFVLRSGAYPSAAGYAAGVSLFDIYGVRALTGYPELALTGTIEITVTTGAVTGTTTAFTTELFVNSIIRVGAVDYRVVSIASDTSMVVERVDGAAVTAVSAGATATRLEAVGGYGVNSPAGLDLTYEGRMNPSSTPYAPRVFPYQKNLSVVTSGIVIVELAPSQTITIDSPIAADTSGRAVLRTTGITLGRSLDTVTTGAGDVAYIRVKLGNEAGAAA